ncbi:NACHT, LRR and PYD domains-containing protein 14-like [Ptychodera flava]|uniref:NACHT, LRR and PYD domains-containing protein 14-like n=1 Tax=Ptychodera flava TaxID=63121 RepID=UPI00396A44F6
MGCSSSSLQQPQSGSGQDNTANQNTLGSNGSQTEQAPSKSNENVQSEENEVGHDDGMGTGSLSESNQKEEGDSGGHSIQTVSQSKSKESTLNSESQSKSPSTKGSSENNSDKVSDAKSSGTSGSKVSSEKMSTTSESSAKPSANTSNTSAVPSSQSKQSNNAGTKIESQHTDADQVEFNSALRAMCRLVRTDELYANVKPGVWSLHLERIPPNPDFSMATLVSKIKNMVELDFSGNRLGPQGFRTAVLALIYNHSVTTLNISNNQADTDSSQCLGELLSNNSTLTWLDVSSNNLGKDFFSRSVGPAIKANNVLKCLRFSSCGSTDLNVFLESLSENSSIVELDFSHNQMSNGSHTGKLIADVLTKTSCCLEVLEMKSTGIDANGMKSLSEGLLGNKTVKKFNAGGNEIATGSHFTDLLLACVCHPSLYALSLDDSKITDKDQTATGTAVKTDLESHLTTLSLVNCNLTDDIIVPLTNQKPGLLVNLTSLDLTNNPDITMATLKSFQQASTKNGVQSSIEESTLV